MIQEEAPKPWPPIIRRSVGIFVVATLAITGWRACHKFANNRDGTMSGQMISGGNREKSVTTRTAPDGSSFTVDTTGASYRLEIGPLDRHSRRVFPSYAAAIRHARDHQLPTIPSTPVVLATCAAIDTRLHAALELALDKHPDFGRRVLIEQWLSALGELRQRMPADMMPACETAIAHLATAAGGGTANAIDPPLGPWATRPELANVWARDRFLGRGIAVSDDRSATAAALLARTQPAAWKDQLAFARALHGEITGPSFESLATALAGISDEDLGSIEALDRVGSEASRLPPATGFAPAALAHASSPEQQVLEPLGMAAWDDPMAALIAAIRSGKLDLTPKAEAGFYRHRWFALETLAAPGKAPEHHKLQLSADYQKRWQRAFAAGFTEGRSGFLKRLPITVMGNRDEGPIRLDLAPIFSAEPSPIVYLRLARAYQKLAADLAAANNPLWQSLLDADGRPLAAELDERILRLHGLAHLVYQEVGTPTPETVSDHSINPSAAAAAAADWLSRVDQDPDLLGDARLLVPLASDGSGSLRCPAVLGIRLEPVKYSWIEKPEVDYRIEARFVPARYWLASPIPALVSVTRIPSPVGFRERCDGHDTVASLCGAFGIEDPGKFAHPLSGWLPWLQAAAGIIAAWWLLGWWWRRPWRARLLVLGGALAGGLVLTTLLIAFPPSGLLKWVWVQVVKAPDGISSNLSYPVVRWIGDRGTGLSTDLLGEPDAQSRYSGAILWLSIEEESRSPVAPATLPMLRTRLRDPVPEVGWAAWGMLMGHPAELPHLIAELTVNPDQEQLWFRLFSFEETRSRSSEVIYAIMELMTSGDPKVRATTIRAAAVWHAPEAALGDQVRIALDDPSPEVRQAAAAFVKRHGDDPPNHDK